MGTPTEPASDAIARIAADWLVKLRDPGLTAADRAAFSRWLQESPVHVREYLAAAESWGIVCASTEWPDTPQEELIAVLRAGLTAVPIPERSSWVRRGAALRSDSIGARVSPWQRAFLAAAAGIVAVIAVLAVLRLGSPRGSFDNLVISTGRGQQRVVVLTDGSVVELNTLTRAVVHFDERVRRLELKEGEAFFRVAHDVNRPFEVLTPLATVRAVGTAFDVYTRTNGTRIAVVEGRVRVAQATADGGVGGERLIARNGRGHVEPRGTVVSLGPQEVLELTRADAEMPSAVADAAGATAWLSHRLVFENERLDVIASEFNRYNALQIAPSPELAALRISGVFDPTDPEALLRYLDRIEGVRIRRADDAATIERSAP